MPRLSSPIDEIKSHYDVVVVGSGYGGAIAASRIARAGKRVCLLERGKELQPGEYPFTQSEALREFQVNLSGIQVGSPVGLYDLRVNDDINVFLGCGLGGTSLVNANVSLQADPRVFQDARWPEELRGDVDGLLELGYRRAEEMLKPAPYPATFPRLPKVRALESSARHLGQPFYRPPINVTFADGVNHVGVQQHACKLCGDCVSGCNYGAKNTTLMNYLPDARNHGAEIYTQVKVRRVQRVDGHWLVHYQLLDRGRESVAAPELFVSADVVILGAGALGSTEILLRSRQAGLATSDMVGQKFSGNGDVLGFGYNTDMVINGIGFGPLQPGVLEPVGPCIAGVIDMRGTPDLGSSMVIQEGVIPGGLSSFLAQAFVAASLLMGQDTDAGVLDYMEERGRELSALLSGPYSGAVRNTLTYLVMSHDDSSGKMELEKDQLRIRWPGVGKQPVVAAVDAVLREATLALGGTYIANPLWSKLAGSRLVTVHPLGGCPMGENAESGAVNHKGQVFAAARGAAVHDGLYVSDAAVIPRSLGVNPLLTISAIAERCCALLARDRGWEIDYSLSPRQPNIDAPAPLGLEFTQRMRGHFSTKILRGYRRGERQGRADNSTLEFVITVISEDLQAMLQSESHRAKIVGTVSAPALSSAPLTVTAGEVNFLVRDARRPATRLIRYRMRLASVEGRTYGLAGRKMLRDDPGFDAWSDNTTLYVSVYDGYHRNSALLGKGILRVGARDLIRQLATLRVLNSRSVEQAVAAKARFGRFFAGALFETYGGPPGAREGSDANAPEEC